MFICFVALAGCATSPSRTFLSLDRPLTITTLDLFAQTETAKGGRPWLGDWEFRRDRLDLIDMALRDLRPDIGVFQCSLRRLGSASEDDSLILKAGALTRHTWQSIDIQTLTESGEMLGLATSVLKPATIELSSVESQKNYWALGADGHLAVFRVLGFGDPILVVNVLMPSRLDQLGLWYSFVKERVLEVVASGRGCLGRIVVAGYLPVDLDNRKAEQFTRSLGLKDSASGFCQNEIRCQTATLSNGIYAATRGDQGSGQMDRILIAEGTQVINADLAFTSRRETDRYQDQYKLNAIWPAQRFGWTAKLRFGSCGAH